MWNRKRKIWKYFISEMVFVRNEKNLDFRAGPDMVDVYERRDRECSKEIYERYSHEKVNSVAACYYRKQDTYTYYKCVGEEIVSPQESYDMVKSLLKKPIDEIKASSKSDIKWAIQAIDILLEEKRREIVRIEMQNEMYTEAYIKSIVDAANINISTLKNNKEKLQNIYDNICNRKNVKLENKRKEEELIVNTLNGVEINCTCGSLMLYSYNKCYCGTCGTNVEKLWKTTAKKLIKNINKNIA